MTRIMTHWATKSALLLVGFLAAVSLVRDQSYPYNYYLTQSSGIKRLLGWVWFGSLPSAALFLACVAGLCVGAAKTRRARTRWWRRADFGLLVVTVLMIEWLCVVSADRRVSPDGSFAYYPSSVGLLALSLLCYLLVVGLVLEATARLRDGVMGETLYWRRFFRLHPLREPIAVVMLVVGVANLLAFLAVLPALHLGDFILPAGFWSMLAALTYFCAYDLSASARHEQANLEKVQAERFKAELITNVSHDIRTPLTSIINYVDLLKGLDVDRDDFREYVAVLEAKSGRLKALLDDLMDASKLTTDAVSMDLRELDLAEIVGQLAGEFDDQFTDRGLALVLRQPDGPVPVNADSRHLWRVLENLFANAVKYSLPGTRVFAEITRVGASAVFSLKNTSLAPIDLPPDALTEQFIRGDRSRHTDGNGLGLFIAKSLTEAMGGAFAITVTGDLFEAHVEFTEVRTRADSATMADAMELR